MVPSPPRNVCVIGGSGFIGSHVADAFSHAGDSVRILDRTPSRYLRPDQRMIVGDALDPQTVTEAIKGCDIVLHFAAISDLDIARLQPVETARVNVLGTVQILDACRSAGVGRFIYASSMYVYSREGGFYRCSKQAAEAYVEEFSQCFGLEHTILRFGSIYGPRSDASNGVYRLVRAALLHGRVEYPGDPNAVRQYVHVRDVAQACLLCTKPEHVNRRLVITGTESIPVRDFLGMICEILGLPPDSASFSSTGLPGHYARTPYAYVPKLGLKLHLPTSVDLGEGLLQLTQELRGESPGDRAS